MSYSLRIKLISILAYAGIVSLLSLSVSCNRTPEESAPEEIAEYVEAYSAGVVKVTSTIQVLFNETVEPADSGSAVSASRLMRFTPSLKGHEEWDGTTRKLEFVPEKGQLKAGNT